MPRSKSDILSVTIRFFIVFHLCFFPCAHATPRLDPSYPSPNQSHPLWIDSDSFRYLFKVEFPLNCFPLNSFFFQFFYTSLKKGPPHSFLPTFFFSIRIFPLFFAHHLDAMSLPNIQKIEKSDLQVVCTATISESVFPLLPQPFFPIQSTLFPLQTKIATLPLLSHEMRPYYRPYSIVEKKPMFSCVTV